MASHKQGGKITRSHTSIIDGARDAINQAEASPLVSKIALGIIKNIGTGKPSLKFHPMVGGFRVIIRANVTIQEFFIYTKSAKEVQDIFRKACR